MTNKEIANTFRDLAALMELHKENPYKIRSYQNAYINLRKLEGSLFEKNPDEWASIKGVGKSIVSKLHELKDSGTIANLEKYRELTPQGIQELLSIKGFGPKKIRVIWKELGVETAGELLYACNENRLVELKGFGAKTQADLIQKLEYFQQSQGKFHYASLEGLAQNLLMQMTALFPEEQVALTGAMRRLMPEIEQIEILTTASDINLLFEKKLLDLQTRKDTVYKCLLGETVPVKIYICEKNEFGSKQFRYTASETFMQSFLKTASATDFKQLATEEAVFQKANIPYILPELRESEYAIQLAQENKLPKLIEETDLRGVLHNHTTYSDGIHSLKEMTDYAQGLGYEYIGITDHSKSAFYASGLKVERLYEQFEEIDQLNAQYSNFKIYKGIESDILNSGELDYEEDVLKQFDFIIASVHSNLKMDEAKATQRLITAIENPYTTILGHPTGRLLLARKGYPIDHKKVIDACAANGVHLELNANPHRLDLDWTWIPYALEKGVMISINPDAHSKEGIQHTRYGVLVARKGLLTQEMCLNALSRADFEQKIIQKA